MIAVYLNNVGFVGSSVEGIVYAHKSSGSWKCWIPSDQSKMDVIWKKIHANRDDYGYIYIDKCVRVRLCQGSVEGVYHDGCCGEYLWPKDAVMVAQNYSGILGACRDAVEPVARSTRTADTSEASARP